jgi:hypothetical protein
MQIDQKKDPAKGVSTRVVVALRAGGAGVLVLVVGVEVADTGLVETLRLHDRELHERICRSLNWKIAETVQRSRS